MPQLPATKPKLVLQSRSARTRLGPVASSALRRTAEEGAERGEAGEGMAAGEGLLAHIACLRRS